MTESEVCKMFFDKLYNCYPVKMKNSCSIFWFYDKKIARKAKLKKLDKNVFNLPDVLNGSCLFEIDLINNILWCDYSQIWEYFQKNYNNDFYNIQSVLEDFLIKMNISHFRIYTKVLSTIEHVYNIKNLNVYHELESYDILKNLRELELNILA